LAVGLDLGVAETGAYGSMDGFAFFGRDMSGTKTTAAFFVELDGSYGYPVSVKETAIDVVKGCGWREPEEKGIVLRLAD
jgi:hypothetical protein